MTHDLYWVALQQSLGEGSPRVADVLQHYDDIEQFWQDKENWRERKIFTPAELKRLNEADFDEAGKIVEHCERRDFAIICPEDENYPDCLRVIKAPPAVLYVQGNLPDMDGEVGIAMVGTRSCTKNGLILGSVLGYRLAQAGAIIVSGGAKGIDTACSRGAVAAGGRSIIVLGCGLDYPYLLDNRRIRDDSAQNGAIITEYPPLHAPSKYTFPVRNRIMSALSKGVVLIEAPEKSGALITASHALEQGKDVFVLPGDITNANYVGNNKLLHDGAAAIYSPEDVLREYIQEYPHKLTLKNASTPLGEDRMFVNMYAKNNRRAEYDMSVTASEHTPRQKPKRVADVGMNYNQPFTPPPLPDGTDEVVKRVYECFGASALSTDKIVSLCGESVSNVMYALTELEIMDRITSLPGGLYKIKN